MLKTRRQRNKAIGHQIEKIVQHWLQNQGLKFIARNWYCKSGEIDLIFQSGTDLVFVEVKYRSPGNYGTGKDAVTYQKQEKLRKAALLYIQQHRWAHKMNIRFDVVAVTGQINSLEIDWIQYAF